MLDQIGTVDKKRLGKYIGSIDAVTMIDIEKALKITLALH